MLWRSRKWRHVSRDLWVSDRRREATAGLASVEGRGGADSSAAGRERERERERGRPSRGLVGRTGKTREPDKQGKRQPGFHNQLKDFILWMGGGNSEYGKTIRCTN